MLANTEPVFLVSLIFALGFIVVIHCGYLRTLLILRLAIWFIVCGDRWNRSSSVGDSREREREGGGREREFHFY